MRPELQKQKAEVSTTSAFFFPSPPLLSLTGTGGRGVWFSVLGAEGVRGAGGGAAAIRSAANGSANKALVIMSLPEFRAAAGAQALTLA